MKKKSKILNIVLSLYITSCTSLTPHLKKSEIDTRQGNVSIINAIGLDKEKDAISLIGKPHKDQNTSDIIRQEYSLQVDF